MNNRHRLGAVLRAGALALVAALSLHCGGSGFTCGSSTCAGDTQFCQQLTSTATGAVTQSCVAIPTSCTTAPVAVDYCTSCFTPGTNGISRCSRDAINDPPKYTVYITQ